MVKNKIKIAVSSCLLGEAVRYDGTDKYVEYITQNMAKEYNLISICPEMAVGMGVPRPPIHLVEHGQSIEVQGVEDASCNMTQELKSYANEFLKNHSDICGYIFKKNSPSCGTKNVKVLNEKGEYELKGQGMYAASIIAALPLLPVIDEEDCLSNKTMEAFFSKVEQYYKDLK